jgi:hypothetical protein
MHGPALDSAVENTRIERRPMIVLASRGKSGITFAVIESWIMQQEPQISTGV